MPTRQERRKAERDAAKRAPAKSGAATAGGAAAARAHVHVIPLGDWRTQNDDPLELFRSLGFDVVKNRAAKGEGEAQFSLGFELVSAASGGPGTPLGAGGNSPLADVGLALSTSVFRVAHRTEARRCGNLTVQNFAGANPTR